MKRFLFFLLACMPLLGYSQGNPKYIVSFTDRSGTVYSTTNPSAYLSQRAIARRVAQGIPVVMNDLPVNHNYIDSVLSKGNVTLHNKSKWMNAISIITTDTNALIAIQALPFVSSVSRVERLKSTIGVEEKQEPVSKVQQPLATVIKPQNLDYGASLTQVSMLGGDCMHSMGYMGQGKVIAVLDAGFQNVDTLSAFDSLWVNNQILGTWDFVTGDSMVFEDNAHGEMVLSTMGAYLQGSIIGTAPKAEYWLLRSEEAASEYVIEEFNWVAAAEFADSVGADIINSSLGYTTFDDPAQNHTYADMNGNTTIITNAADMAVSKGIFVVNSAGNSGSSSWFYIGAPADGDSVLAVGAVDANEAYASFSSRGPSADGRIKPDVAAMGQGTIVAGPAGGTFQANGTSFSGPLTAGMVACLWQAHPALTARQLYNAIIQSADQYSNPDDYLGYGIPDFCSANIILGGGDPAAVQEDGILSLFPNPFQESFEFTFYSDRDQMITIELYDAIGRVVMQKNEEVYPRTHNRYIVKSYETLGPGVYFLVVRTQEGKMVRKVDKF